jgi:acetyltransferase EpsM
VANELIPVVILGAGGYAGVLQEILALRPDLHLLGCTDKAFGLSERSPDEHYSLPILGDDDALPQIQAENPYLQAVLGLGPDLMEVRVRLMQVLDLQQIPAVTAIHPRAIVSRTAQMGDGVVVAAGAIVGPGVRMGRHCVVNIGASVEHDAVLGNNVFVGQGARIASYVDLRDNVVVEMGASINSRVQIGPGARVTGGAFVNTDVPEHAVVVGVPARVVRYLPS